MRGDLLPLQALLLPEMKESLRGALIVLAIVAVQIVLAGAVLLRPQKRQSSSLAWILVILTLPGLGALAFFLFGEVRMGTKRVRRHRDIVQRIRTARIEQWQGEVPPELPKAYRPIAALAYLIGETTPHGGNRLQLLAGTEDVIESLVRDIDRAERHCHLLYYIYMPDASGQKVAQALIRAAGRGVQCRLLVDAVGSARLLDSMLKRELRKGGVDVVAALPTHLRLSAGRIDLRNHRKIAVIDGLVAYTGSHNVADAAFATKPRFAPWVDATVRVQGPAVRDLQELFIQDWYMDKDESHEDLLAISPPEEVGGVPVQVMGTGPNCKNDALVQLMQAAFHTAREELILTTPYFVPDEGTLDALATASLRGVSTILVVPRRNDSWLVGAASRSFYEPLLEAGVEIFEYTKGLLHAKTITVDRNGALVSTANLDRRSFELNFEVSLSVYDSDFASHLRFLQRSYMEDSEPIDASRWSGRRWPRRIAHNAAGILAPLL